MRRLRHQTQLTLRLGRKGLPRQRTLPRGIDHRPCERCEKWKAAGRPDVFGMWECPCCGEQWRDHVNQPMEGE